MLHLGHELPISEGNLVLLFRTEAKSDPPPAGVVLFAHFAGTFHRFGDGVLG